MAQGKHPMGDKLMLAFAGHEVPPRVAQWLQERPLGGFTLFRSLNVERPAQVRALNGRLQALAAEAGQPPLLIAADQEGGQLNALGEATTRFAGNMALAATRDSDLARRVGQALGRELAAMGINVNYAPVCDINTNPQNPAAGVRTFGDQAVLAAELVPAMVAGMQAAGVAATAKHFPGIGEAREDSHEQMPLVDHKWERLREVELRPFRAAIDANVKMVMSGHFAIPAITGSDVPATLSPAVIHGLLREELQFEGIVITDALDMGAITQGGGQLIDVIAAVRAGVDLLLTANQPQRQEQLYAGLQLAYARGLFNKARLENSRRRIMALKAWVGAQQQPDLSVVGCRAHQQLAQEVAARSLTLVRNAANLLPLRLAPAARVAVVMPQPQDLTPADTSSYVKPSLAAALRRYHSPVDEFITAPAPADDEIAALRRTLAEYDLLMLGTLSATMQPAQATLARALLAMAVPTVTVALRTPYDLGVYPQAETHVCTYSILPPSMQALAAALFGHAAFSGRLPVTIAGLYPFGHGLR